MEQKAPKKTNLNLLILGTEQSAKSALISTLVSRIKDSSSKEDKNIIETLKSERERGGELHLSDFEFETASHNFTLVEAPGHRDFVFNLLSGSSKVDVAVLTVSAIESEFESGLSQDGTNKDQLNFVESLGIRHLIICVNKVNSIGFSQEKFEVILATLQAELNKLSGIKHIQVIPVSHETGDNLIDNSANLAWFKGATLLGALNNLPSTKQPLENNPLRIPIQDVFKIAGVGTTPSGRVESGTLKAGVVLDFVPRGGKSEFKQLETIQGGATEGHPGDNIGFSIKDPAGKTVIKRGQVASDSANHPAKEVVAFTAQIILAEGEINVGFESELHIHTAVVPCKITQISAKIERRTSKVTEINPNTLRKADSAIVVITPTEPLTCETFADFPALGRFVLKSQDLQIAVGIVTRIQTN